MKVILLQEIKGQGGEGDVVEVKRGYAVNYLFPQKMAIEASKGNLKQLELRKHNIAKREAERLDSADKIQAALSDKVLVVAARVGEEGQLFGSVTSQQIADRLHEELGLEIDRKKIDLGAPIKTAGEHNVTVTVYRDIKAVLTVSVVSDALVAKEEASREAAEEVVAEESDEAAEIAEIAEAEEAVEAEDAVEAEVADEAEEAVAAEEAAEDAVNDDAADEEDEDVEENAVADANDADDAAADDTSDADDATAADDEADADDEPSEE